MMKIKNQQPIEAKSLPYDCTIVLTNYNHAEFVSEAISSVGSQTYERLFLIVIDDCSTDSSVKIIEEALLKLPERIKYSFIKNPKNIGVSASRNLGILATQTPFIAFLDSDDWYFPDKITLSIAKLAEFPGIGLAYSDYDMLDTRTGIQRREFKAPFSSKQLLNYCMVSTNSVMKREVFDKVGYFPEEFHIGEDYYLYMRISTKYMISHIPYPLFCYRTHGNNATSKITKEYYEENDKKLKQKFLESINQKV